MAGFIHISGNVGCSMGSQDFRALVEAVRSNFQPDENEIAAELYEYFDATSDCLMILNGKSKRVLNAFYNAVRMTSDRDPSLYDVVGHDLINELLDKLKSDPRIVRS